MSIVYCSIIGLATMNRGDKFLLLEELDNWIIQFRNGCKSSLKIRSEISKQ